ncbi:DivIVA domain-containing protein [Cellulomonas wangsupingiae]|uniref:DivIVA domain-containing protein n=1 Tax=Cellulomonas wangsupingiae TaxID=2968085 RepID=UPI001D0DD131|nr:DivIVA domain-containing protein [Cellulomonas wangsupingiae]MCM0641247.1 DivIVA domain-containing protein [Cellulomonas wangsupingiae]
MLTAEDVLHARLATTKFAEGYERSDVDDLLDRVVVTLRAVESGQPSAVTVTADDVGHARFQVTRFREGYAQGPVDDLLQDVVTTLQAHGAVTAPPVPVAAPPGGGTTVPGLVPERQGWWRRVFGA